MEIKNNTSILVEMKKTSLEKTTEVIKMIFRGLIILFLLIAIAGAASQSQYVFSSSPYSVEYTDWYGKTLIIPQEEIPVKQIALIEINGMIGHKSMNIIDGTMSEHVLQMLDDIEKDPAIQALVVKIDSPGGTVLDSEKIAEKLSQIRKEKKVYALLESLAASGGYYIASQSDKIFAYNETLTGSIGVIMHLPNTQKLMEKVGVDVHAITSGNMKAMGSPFQELSPEVEQIFQTLVNESYDGFITRVSEGRNMDKETVRTLADGRIYSGKQAMKLGLVDSTKGLTALLEELDAKGFKDVPVLKFFIPRSPLEEILNPVGMAIQSWFPKKTEKAIMYFL